MDKLNLINKIISETGASTFNLGNCNINERLAYISIISSTAWADGSIDSRELEILKNIANAAGPDIEEQLDLIISETQRFNINKYEEWVADITTEPLKIGLLTDMFLTSFADSICMQSESIYMKYIAGKLGITDEIYNVIRRNVEDYLNSQNNGNTMSYEEGVAHETENRPETEEESNLRSVINSLMKSVILAI